MRLVYYTTKPVFADDLERMSRVTVGGTGRRIAAALGSLRERESLDLDRRTIGVVTAIAHMDSMMLHPESQQITRDDYRDLMEEPPES